MKVVIDQHSGFCFGVKRAISAAEALLATGEKVYCVGDIVHNEAEAKRLEQLGMTTISHDGIANLTDGSILFRAHGEPPASYQSVKNQGVSLSDQTCPVVLKLQQRVKSAYQHMKTIDGVVLIYGKKGHAEVNGLVGQTNNEAIVIEHVDEVKSLDVSRPLVLFSQTTKDPDALKTLVKTIETKKGAAIEWHNTTCKQVTGRVPRLTEFAKQFDVIVFVGGLKSSNAQVLFNACKSANANSYFISSKEEVDVKWFKSVNSVGVCGATSTPDWLMEQVAEAIRKY